MIINQTKQNSSIHNSLTSLSIVPASLRMSVSFVLILQYSFMLVLVFAAIY